MNKYIFQKNYLILFFLIFINLKLTYAEFDAERYIKFAIDDANLELGVRIGEYVWEDIVEKQDKEIAKETKWEKSEIDAFQFDGIDVANQNIKFSCDLRHRQYEDINPLRCCEFFVKVLDITCGVSGTLNPVVANDNFTVSTQDLNTDDCDPSGLGLYNFLSYLGLHPVLGMFGPEGILTTNLILNEVAETFVNDGLASQGETAEAIGKYNEIMQTVREYDALGIIGEDRSEFDEKGMWIWYSFDYSNLALIYNNIISKTFYPADILSSIPHSELIQEIALEILGRLLTDDELDYYGALLADGASLSDLRQIISDTFEAKNRKFQQVLYENDINANYKNLVISISGAGVYPQAIDETDNPVEVLTYGDKPSSQEYFGDGIYQFAYKYLNQQTVAVIGYPWFTISGDPIIDDRWWEPDRVAFANWIKVTLSKMASDSKLILIGKSMGGCIIHQITEKLADIDVDVDLLILVDASCKPADQSDDDPKNLQSNIRKVYNFRQTRNYPDNDYQNGFQVLPHSSTKSYEIVVSDEDASTNNLLCEGVGHDDIDECNALLSEIDRIIQLELHGDYISIINALLLD